MNNEFKNQIAEMGALVISSGLLGYMVGLIVMW